MINIDEISLKKLKLILESKIGSLNNGDKLRYKCYSVNIITLWIFYDLIYVKEGDSKGKRLFFMK